MRYGTAPGPLTGAPGALGRVLRFLASELGAGAIDVLWIFPAIPRDRGEQGLVVASCLGPPDGRRRLFTVAYRAERSREGVRVAPTLTEEGLVPRERAGRIVEGVARRSGAAGAEPSGGAGGVVEHPIRGDPDRLSRLIRAVEGEP